MPQKGILLHISSLPGDFGIGDFGPSAYQFVDYLASRGYHYWQILPLNPPAYGNSPYNPLSCFALNPQFISPELLHQNGLISDSELDDARLPHSDRVDYHSLQLTKTPVLHSACRVLIDRLGKQSLYDSMDPDLKPFFCYEYLSRINGSTAWYTWPMEDRSYSEALFERLQSQAEDELLIGLALQFLARRQLADLLQYAHSRDIRIIGDVPLYLAYDSAELWAYQQYFKLHPDGSAAKIAGVPPDAFSADGQLWGNPVYDWDRLAKDQFSFLFKRIGKALEYADILRLDHFIGYVNYWEVDGDQTTATNGIWQDARPGEFFSELFSRWPRERFIAEDLGILNDKVCAHRDQNGLSGMIVLQFCFEDSVPQPSQYPSSFIIYTGTHDNKTSRQWYEELEPDQPSYQNLMAYLEQNPALVDQSLPLAEQISWIMIDIAQSSPCRIAICPMQDVLALGASARMNVPGVALGNWQWRMRKIPSDRL